MYGPYADNPQVQFLGIGDRSSSSEADVQNWINVYDWDFPTGIDDPGRPIYASYGVTRDTFVVLDQNGVVQFVNGYLQNTAAITFPFIKMVIDDLLAVPVEEQTWGSLKNQFRE